MNNNGFSLISLLISLAVSSVVILGLSSVQIRIVRSSLEAETVSKVRLTQTDLTRMVKDDIAWENTLAANPNLRTLLDPDPAVAGGPIVIDLRDDQDTSFTAAGVGMTHQGALCNTYDNNSYNSACPYRFSATSTVECTDGAATCQSPLVHVDLNFETGLAHDPMISSPDKFSIRVTRDISQQFEDLTLECISGSRAAGTDTVNSSYGGDVNEVFESIAYTAPEWSVRCRDENLFQVTNCASSIPSTGSPYSRTVKMMNNRCTSGTNEWNNMNTMSITCCRLRL